MKNFATTYGALEDYDVNKLYVDEESLRPRGPDRRRPLVPVEVMSRAEIGS